MITAKHAGAPTPWDVLWVPRGCWLYGDRIRDELVMPDDSRVAIHLLANSANAFQMYQDGINEALKRWIG